MRSQCFIRSAEGRSQPCDTWTHYRIGARPSWGAASLQLGFRAVFPGTALTSCVAEPEDERAPALSPHDQIDYEDEGGGEDEEVGCMGGAQGHTNAFPD